MKALVPELWSVEEIKGKCRKESGSLNKNFQTTMQGLGNSSMWESSEHRVCKTRRSAHELLVLKVPT